MNAGIMGDERFLSAFGPFGLGFLVNPLAGIWKVGGSGPTRDSSCEPSLLECLRKFTSAFADGGRSAPFNLCWPLMLDMLRCLSYGQMD